MFKKFFDYYGLSKREQRGFFVLVLLLLSVILFQEIFDFFDRTELVNYQVVQFDDAPSLNRQWEGKNELATQNDTKQFEKRTQINYFTFDPNGLPVGKWQELGFSAKQAAAIKNYEAKGGKFRKKEDVAKLFVVSEKDYARIAPYIVIESTRESEETVSSELRPHMHTERNREMVTIEVNTADTSEFKLLRGIGSTLASRTVRYREALGGFHDITQVGEVYGISPELFETLKPQLLLSKPQINKINVNGSSISELSKHPYISRKHAQLIVNYRKQHGSYTSFSDLRNIHALDEDFLRKIEPYLEW